MEEKQQSQPLENEENITYTRSFSIEKAISFGWNKFKEDPWFLVYLFLIVFLINIVIGGIGIILENVSDIAVSIFNLIGMVVGIFISLGLIKIILSIYDNGKKNLSDIFSQTDILIRAIGAYIVFSIAVGIGLLLLVIPGIYIAIRLFFFDYFLVDQRQGAIEALKSSWNMTKGNVFQIFCFIVLLILINLLGALALMVGLLVTAPVSGIAMAFAYRKMSGSEKKKATENEEEHEEEHKEEGEEREEHEEENNSEEPTHPQ